MGLPSNRGPHSSNGSSIFSCYLLSNCPRQNLNSFSIALDFAFTESLGILVSGQRTSSRLRFLESCTSAGRGGIEEPDPAECVLVLLFTVTPVEALEGFVVFSLDQTLPPVSAEALLGLRKGQTIWKSQWGLLSAGLRRLGFPLQTKVTLKVVKPGNTTTEESSLDMFVEESGGDQAGGRKSRQEASRR